MVQSGKGGGAGWRRAGIRSLVPVLALLLVRDRRLGYA